MYYQFYLSTNISNFKSIIVEIMAPITSIGADSVTVNLLVGGVRHFHQLRSSKALTVAESSNEIGEFLDKNDGNANYKHSITRQSII